MVTAQPTTKVSLLFRISGNYIFSVLLGAAADASTPEYAAVDMSRKRSKRRPDVMANTAAANGTEYANVTQRQQVEIPATKTATLNRADDAVTNSRPEQQENPEYYNHLETNVAMTAAGDLDTEMTENDVYERGDDLQQGGDLEQGGAELYSLQQPVTDEDAKQGDYAEPDDDAADDTDDVQMQENEIYES